MFNILAHRSGVQTLLALYWFAVLAQYWENFTGPVKSRYVYFTGPVSQNILAQYKSGVQTLLALYWYCAFYAPGQSLYKFSTVTLPFVYWTSTANSIGPVMAL